MIREKSHQLKEQTVVVLYWKYLENPSGGSQWFWWNIVLCSLEAHVWELIPENRTHSGRDHVLLSVLLEAIAILWLFLLFCFPPRGPYEKKFDTFIPLEPLPKIPKWVFHQVVYDPSVEMKHFSPMEGPQSVKPWGPFVSRNRVSAEYIWWTVGETHGSQRVCGIWPWEGAKFYIWHWPTARCHGVLGYAWESSLHGAKSMIPCFQNIRVFWKRNTHLMIPTGGTWLVFQNQTEGQ